MFSTPMFPLERSSGKSFFLTIILSERGMIFLLFNVWYNVHIKVRKILTICYCVLLFIKFSGIYSSTLLYISLIKFLQPMTWLGPVCQSGASNDPWCLFTPASKYSLFIKSLDLCQVRMTTSLVPIPWITAKWCAGIKEPLRQEALYLATRTVEEKMCFWDLLLSLMCHACNHQ